MEQLLSFAKRYRIPFSRVLLGIVILAIVLSDPVWSPGPLASVAVDLVAFVLVLTAAFGRLWALSYISGHKTRDLITQGPYSMVRNPLYFFSLAGVLGIGMLTKSIIILGLIVLAFAVYYPLVIRAEEKHLERVHGERFRRYRSRVPAFVPRFKAYEEPVEYPVNARQFRRAFFSVMWFPLVYMMFLFIGRLHAAGMVPALLSIP